MIALVSTISHQRIASPLTPNCNCGKGAGATAICTLPPTSICTITGFLEIRGELIIRDGNA